MAGSDRSARRRGAFRCPDKTGFVGAAHRHWFRAKLGANRFRPFFRADSAARIVVCARVNDRGTPRKAGAATDPRCRNSPACRHLAIRRAAQDPAAVERFSATSPDP